MRDRISFKKTKNKKTSPAEHLCFVFPHRLTSGEPIRGSSEPPGESCRRAAAAPLADTHSLLDASGLLSLSKSDPGGGCGKGPARHSLGGWGGMRQGASSCSCRAGSESAEAHLCQTCAKTPECTRDAAAFAGVMCLQHWCIHSYLRAGGTLSDDKHLSARFRACICPTSLCSPLIGPWYGFASCDLSLIPQLCVKVRLASASSLQRT